MALLDLKDLQALLVFVGEARQGFEACVTGNISTASIARSSAGLLVGLDGTKGGSVCSGEPAAGVGRPVPDPDAGRRGAHQHPSPPDHGDAVARAPLMRPLLLWLFVGNCSRNCPRWATTRQAQAGLLSLRRRGASACFGPCAQGCLVGTRSKGRTPEPVQGGGGIFRPLRTPAGRARGYSLGQLEKPGAARAARRFTAKDRRDRDTCGR